MSSVERAYEQFCRERFPLPVEADITAFEQRIDVVFPADYRQFLLQFNGGNFSEPRIVPPDPDWPHDRLRFMHGIRASHRTAELGRPRDLELWDDNDPPLVVPIGYTIMGYFIWLITEPVDYGMIALRSFTETFLLADSIWDFFDLLQEPADE